MDMVERVARALEPYLHESLTPQARDEAPRAAMKAMRELTDGMMGITGKVTTIHGTEFTFCGEDLVKNGMWRAMIDIALSDNIILFDPINQLMKTKGMTFPEAIEHLADKRGLS